MKRALDASGYTIIEVMIVLVISGAMLGTVATMVSGQQERTEFSTATRELESDIQDIFNDVESGIFDSNGQLSCDDPSPQTPVSPIIGTAAKEQGTNGSCILVGKAIEFYQEPGGTVSSYAVAGIVGKRQYRPPTGPVTQLEDVSSLDDAKPVLFYNSADTSKNSIDNNTINSGLEMSNIYYFDNAGAAIAGSASKGLAVIGQLGIGGKAASLLDPTGEGTNNYSSDGGARLARLDFNLTATQQPPELNPDFVTKVNNMDGTNMSGISGVAICLNRGPGSRVSAVTIGVELDGGAVRALGQRNKTNAYFDNDARVFGCTS
jgi:type II secretory pathway pseudopilin PulG